MALGDSDPRSLHDVAVDITTDVQKLATGLAHAGANPQAVQQLTQFGEHVAQIAKVLAQSPGVEQAAQSGPTAPGASPAAAGPPQAQSPQAAQPGPPPGAHPATLGAAAHALHQAMIASASQRQS